MVLVVLAIVVTIGYPSFTDAIRSNRIATKSNEFIAAMSLARSEAIRSNQGSGVCPSADGETCGGTWNDGWLVWVEEGAPNGTIEAGEQIVRYVQAGNQLSFTDDDDATDYIGFTARGLRSNGGAAPVAFTLEPEDCREGAPHVRQLRVMLTGQVSMTRAYCD